MSKTIITSYRKIDPWGVEAAKLAPWIAEKHRNGHNRKWLLSPVHALLPGHDWANDETYLNLTYKMSGQEIEFAKAWVRNPTSKVAAVREIFPRRLVISKEYHRATILSKRLPVINLRDYLLGLYMRERRRTDKLRVTPEQILCELETVWLESCRGESKHDRDRVERLGKFIWAVRTGIWGGMKLRAQFAGDLGTVEGDAKALSSQTPYTEEELAEYLRAFAGDKDISGVSGGNELRGPELPPAERATT